MGFELDHAFLCCAEGAPEGDALVAAGIAEGPRNTHPGQGTANRRFFLERIYLELLWVSDAGEAQSPASRPTRLWERWSSRGSGACPFGLVFRPGPGPDVPAPVPTWEYRPSYLPPGMALEIAKGVPLEEPELIFLRTGRRTDGGRPTGVRVWLPAAVPVSPPAQIVRSGGLVTYLSAESFALELWCLPSGRSPLDLRPALPLRLEPL